MWLDVSIYVCEVWPKVSMKCEQCCQMSRWSESSVDKCGVL